MSTAQKQHHSEQWYIRFSIFQRVEHLVLILSFTLLGLTGLPQKYPTAGVSEFIVGLLGGIETMRIIHRVAATVFLLEAIYHVVVIGYKLFVQRKAASMVPGVKDGKDAIQWFGYNLGLVKEPPKMPRYNFMEKAEYWAMLWGLFIMALTGFMLWNPIATTRILPGEFIPAAKAAHGGEALLAVLAIILWHFYNVHIKQFNKSMFTGKMPRHEMEEEHALELEAIESGQVEPDPEPHVVRSRTMIFAPIAAVVSLALLAGVYWFVSFEESAITTLPEPDRVAVFSPRTPTPRPTLPPTPTAAPTQPGQEQPGGGAVAWDTNIAALFQQRCAACHGQIGGYNAESYENATAAITPGDAAASRVVEVQQAGHPGQFSEDELSQVMAWIDSGAPETAAQAGGGSAEVAWQSGIGDLFRQRCTACHGQTGGYNAESYDNAMQGIEPGNPDNSAVISVQEEGHPGQFTPEELEQIRAWIAAGAPEAGAAASGGAQGGDGNPMTWNGGLQEVFAANCSNCHGSLGNFNVRTYDNVMKGVKPGDADQSPIVQVMRKPGGHPGDFSDEELAQVINWINAGAPQE